MLHDILEFAYWLFVAFSGAWLIGKIVDWALYVPIWPVEDSEEKQHNDVTAG